ncbi:MAG: bacteriocin family protein [Actinomycetota bacterium]|nr:bacteriocin family protein [Actinomycetota bacterium]
MTDHLLRNLAPVSDEAWAAIDEEAVRTLRHLLAGRVLVEFAGPEGWRHSAHDLGRVTPVAGPSEGVTGQLRVVQPLVELRTVFDVPRVEIDAVDRGSEAPDLAAVVDAARRAALAEDAALFHGYAAAGIAGIAGASSHPPAQLTDDYDNYPTSVARAVAALRQAGVGGTYALALGSRCYTGVVETTEHGGYPLLEHLRLIVGGPVLWAPGVDGAVLLSQRGGDYRFVCGQDFSIGYLSHDDTAVRLYVEESFTFQVLEDSAAVWLRYPPA